MAADILRSIPQLNRARDDWDRLAGAFATPLLEHDWFACCARALHQEADLRIVQVRSGGAVTGIAPLALEQTPHGQRLALLGSSTLHEPGGWLFDGPRALDALLRSVVRTGVPAVVRRVPADSPLCGDGISLAGWGARVTRPTKPSLAVRTAGGWDGYVARLSSRITENLPRRRRKAERELGRVEARVFQPTPGEVPDLLASFVRVESSGWKGRAGSSLLHRNALHSFFADYCGRAAARRRLRVATLTFGSTLAAMEFAVEAYCRVWQLKIGFLDALAAYYPGLQLTYHSIKETFDAGLEAYEFLGSAEPWEERWDPVARRYALVALYPFGVRGIAGAVADVAHAVSRRGERAKLNPTGTSQA